MTTGDGAGGAPSAGGDDPPPPATVGDRSGPRGDDGPAGADRRGAVTIVLPGQLRDLAGGRAAVRVDGQPGTVREALAALAATHPAVHHRLLTERGELRPHVNVFVGGREIRRLGGLDARLEGKAELVVLPSVSGG